MNYRLLIIQIKLIKLILATQSENLRKSNHWFVKGSLTKCYQEENPDYRMPDLLKRKHYQFKGAVVRAFGKQKYEIIIILILIIDFITIQIV